MLVEHAAEVTERLREEGEESEIGLAFNEAICPSCSFAYLVPAGASGVCGDCALVLEEIFSVRYVEGVPA